jgi:hypothetical protein
MLSHAKIVDKGLTAFVLEIFKDIHQQLRQPITDKLEVKGIAEGQGWRSL